jgi:hypothetical protein
VTVWEITNKWMNDVAAVGPDRRLEFDPDKHVAFWKQFEGDFDGQPLHWSTRPKLVILEDEGRKKPLPRADISPFTAPGLIINVKARNALGDLLSPFGQLLEVDVAGQTEYYYNVTNILDCVDRECSEMVVNYIQAPVFHEHLIPVEPAIFRDAAVATRIFVNDAAKALLEERIAANKIVGMSFKAWKQNK